MENEKLLAAQDVIVQHWPGLLLGLGLGAALIFGADILAFLQNLAP